METPDRKAPAKKKPETIELIEAARIECSHTPGNEARKYFVTLVPRRMYTVVDNLELEIDPYKDLIRKSKLDEIRSELKIKG